MKENNDKNIFPLVLIVAVILILVGGAYWYSQQMKNVEPEKVAEPTGVKIIDAPESTESEDLEEVEEDTEEDLADEVAVEAEEESEEDIIVALKELFAEKYDKEVEDMTVTISELEGDYLVGGVKFEGEVAGAHVLAAKVDGEWTLVFDGNGTIPCEGVDAVDFPASLVAECWDEATMTSVVRE